MKLFSLVEPVAAVLGLASVVGCAVPAGDAPAPVEAVATTSEALTPVEGVSVASGIFGIVNGAFTAYTTIDNLVRYGNTTANQEILDQLRKANDFPDPLLTERGSQLRARARELRRERLAAPHEGGRRPPPRG